MNSPFRRFVQRGLSALLLAISGLAQAQSGSWQMWASGLPQGTGPRMAVGSNHDVFFAYLALGGPKGLVYKANAQAVIGAFAQMAPIPMPTSATNNIVSLTTNALGEPVAGIFRNDVTQPWLFRFNNATQQWVAATTTTSPVLGASSMACAPDGTLWVGAKWANVYKSTDHGATFTAIDETALVKATMPCYYPSYYNLNIDGAIYGINVDATGRVYAGTESAGVVYSDDNGATWLPADFGACNGNSPMKPTAASGNVAGLGFTARN